MTISQLYSIYLLHPEICTDTRKISKGCLFFALKGDHFNGNKFAEDALRAGASYAVVDEEEYVSGTGFILVKDVLTSLQDLARHHRAQLNIPFIGITGTNGKTTTKELIYSVLSQRYKTMATQGNLNNHIGVPLTVLSVGSETELAVIEMGANHQKEIEFLCGIAQPTQGLITNVGKAHLEGFGGFEGVKIAKGELYSFLAQTNGTVFINQDNPELSGMISKVNAKKQVKYSEKPGAYLSGKLISSSPFIELEWQQESDEKFRVHSQLTGVYNLENILAAICIGCYFGLSPEEINAGISGYQPANNRSQLLKTEHNLLICDYYNANPSSMAVALLNLEAIEAGNKAFIVGDMFELGEESAAEHALVLQKAMQVYASRRIFIGEEFYKLSGTASAAEFYRTTAEASEALSTHPVLGSTVLIKGSRGMKLEGLIKQL